MRRFIVSILIFVLFTPVNDIANGQPFGQSSECDPDAPFGRIALNFVTVPPTLPVLSVPSLNEDGSLIAFSSNSPNITPDDPNPYSDIFLYHRLTCEIEQITTQFGNFFSPKLSADGRFIAFTSEGPLLPNDTNQMRDAYLYDRQTGLIELLSVSSTGAIGFNHSGANSISADGRYVAIGSLTNFEGGSFQHATVWLRDRLEGTTTLVSTTYDGQEPNMPSYDPIISGDGRVVVFYSYATNLLPGVVNDRYQSYIYDVETQTLSFLSINSLDELGNRWTTQPYTNANGELFTFVSDSTNFSPVQTLTDNIFLSRRENNRTLLVSHIDGTLLLSGNDWSGMPTLSGDGQIRVFVSMASNLIVNDTNQVADVFVETDDRHVRRLPFNLQPDDHSYAPAISGDGRVVAFLSSAKNLTPSDTPYTTDVFWVNMREPLPSDFDLIENGDFSQGMVGWRLYGNIVAALMGETFAFYHNNSSGQTESQAVIFQQTVMSLPERTPLDLTFTLQNIASIRQRIVVLVHEADFSDLNVCSFWLPPSMSAPAAYRMRFTTSDMRWQNAAVSFYAATMLGAGWLKLDDVHLVTNYEGYPTRRSACFDPFAP